MTLSKFLNFLSNIFLTFKMGGTKGPVTICSVVVKINEDHVHEILSATAPLWGTGRSGAYMMLALYSVW